MDDRGGQNLEVTSEEAQVRATRTKALADAQPRPVVLVLHQEQSTPGHIGNTLSALGHPLDIRRPRFGDPLPETLADHDGAVIFGGPMSANDPDDYITRETDWIGVALQENAPFLGVCLGAQMLARHLGASVSRHPDGFVEIGYHDLEPRPGTPELAGGAPWPTRAYQWHSEGFTLPDGAEPLVVGGNAFPNQAFRVGRTAYGIQFHPEITYAMVARWSGHNSEKLTQAGAQARPAQMRDHIAHGRAVRRWLWVFLQTWVNEGRRARGVPALPARSFAGV
ncbi:MAG: glutamine amidotransferase [Pseudomonadota bacterium]